MARRKYEFRPDRTDSGILNKLYLTKKQRLSILKWLLYSLILVLLSVLQDVILSRVHLFGATTDLVPCAVILICILEGSENSCIFALAAACTYLFSGTAPGHYCIPFLTFLALGAAIFRQSFLRKGFSATMLCLTAATILYEMLVFATGVLLGNTTLSRYGIFLLTGLLSLIAAPILYPIALSIGKIGGETWKD